MEVSDKQIKRLLDSLGVYPDEENEWIDYNTVRMWLSSLEMEKWLEDNLRHYEVIFSDSMYKKYPGAAMHHRDTLEREFYGLFALDLHKEVKKYKSKENK